MGHSRTWRRQLGCPGSALQRAEIRGTYSAFAAILADGSVVTWGDLKSGGNSPKVKDRLKGVRQIQATGGAFAAILENGSIVTWGDPAYGGDCSEVQHQLADVQQIQATGGAFAAILVDGSVITWGYEPLQPYWQMDQLLHGAILNLVVTAHVSNIS